MSLSAAPSSGGRSRTAAFVLAAVVRDVGAVVVATAVAVVTGTLVMVSADGDELPHPAAAIASTAASEMRHRATATKPGSPATGGSRCASGGTRHGASTSDIGARHDAVL